MEANYLSLDEYLYCKPSSRLKLITDPQIIDLYLEINGKYIALHSSKIEKTNTCVNVKYVSTVQIARNYAQSLAIQDRIFVLQAEGVTIIGNIHEIGKDNKGTYEFILSDCILQEVHANGILEFYGTDGYFHYLDIYKPYSRLFYILCEKAQILLEEQNK